MAARFEKDKNPSQGSTSSAFRSDIEGLRGLAVTSVVLYHGGEALLPGGYVGVDVFYVISGYLITGILVRELRAGGRIDLREFWARRARRLLPSAAVVLLATALGSALLLSPVDYRDAGREIAASGGYVVNWWLASRQVDYLASQEQPSVVLHFWSLAVEEQFYVFWPLALFGAAWCAGGRARPGVLRFAVIALGVSSFVSGLYWMTVSQPHAFFGTTSRIWQLLVGAALVVWPDDGRDRPAVRSAASWLGFGGVVAAMTLFSREIDYPGYAALLPTFATAAWIFAGGGRLRGWTPHALLESTPMRFLGRVSYSWYLWHWPVMLFGPIWWSGPETPPGPVQQIVWGAVSLGIATAAWRLVENPLRFHRVLVRSPRLSLSLAATVALAVAASGLALIALESTATIVLRDGSELALGQVLRDRASLYRDGCHLSMDEVDLPGCRFGDPAADRTVVLFGDSHAAQWFPALEEAARASGWALIARTKSACPATRLLFWSRRLGRPYTECAQWRSSVLAEFERLEPDLVIVAGTAVPLLVSPAAGYYSAEEQREGRRAILEELRAVVPRIVVMRDTPQLPRTSARCLLRNPGAEDACRWERHRVLDEASDPSVELADLFSRVEHVDLSDSICDAAWCPAVVDGVVVMYDTHHLSATFVRRLTSQFAELLAGRAQGG
jgi:peptidoglycan/LPS O-acetylase OafA/YrhL